MADQPRWMQYVDLSAKIAIPITVLAATLAFNIAAERRHHTELAAERTAQRTQQCFDNQFKLISAICQDADCKAKGQRTTQIVSISSLTGPICREAGVEVAPALKNSATQAAATGGNVSEAASVAVALGAAPTRTQRATGAVAIAPEAAGAQTSAPRLYIQTASADQSDGVKALIQRLRSSNFYGQSVVGLGPELVARPVQRTQLRCVTTDDCKKVAALAAYLTALLGQQVVPVDISDRYAGSSNARPGHYELWLAPGPVSVMTS